MTTPLPRERHHYTYEAYLTYEHDSARKHEFDAGEIVALVESLRGTAHSR